MSPRTWRIYLLTFLLLIISGTVFSGTLQPVVRVNHEQSLEQKLKTIPGVSDAQVAFGRNQAVAHLKVKMNTTIDQITWIKYEASRIIRSSEPTLQGHIVYVDKPKIPTKAIVPY